AEPVGEGDDSGGDGPQVHRREPAQAGSQGRGRLTGVWFRRSRGHCPRLLYAAPASGALQRPSLSFRASTLSSVATVATTNFADRLAEAVEHKRSQLVVGLDPRPDQLPVELRGEAHLGRPEAADACARFCRGIVDAVSPYVVAVKPQIAFFEALGSDGARAFENVCASARAAGLQVIADAKRGDIGPTARAYAAAYIERSDGRVPLADAVTVNPYLGRDSVEPFLAAC